MYDVKSKPDANIRLISDLVETIFTVSFIVNILINIFIYM